MTAATAKIALCWKKLSEMLDIFNSSAGEPGEPGPPGKPGVDGVNLLETDLFTGCRMCPAGPRGFPGMTFFIAQL